MKAPAAYERLVKRVEWKLMDMPLPRLQLMGRAQSRFTYEINWEPQVEQRDVARYQSGEADCFNNRLLLKHWRRYPLSGRPSGNGRAANRHAIDAHRAAYPTGIR
jgi:hypothetical protein